MQSFSKYHQSNQEISSEAGLIIAAQKEPELFETLYLKYYEQIFLFIYQRVDSKETASDITSQVFLKALVNLSRYQFKGVPFSAWLYRIAINELNTCFKTNAKQRALNVEAESMEEIMEELQDDHNEEKHQQVIRALTRLPEMELQFIEMRFFEKRSFKEIGDIFRITENNAKVKLYRILSKLRRIIESTRN